MMTAEKNRPVYISVEGLDGSGKNLQANMLADRLRGRGHAVALVDFPRYDSFFGKEIGAYLSGSGGVRIDEMDVKSISLWFAMDRWHRLSGAGLDGCDFVIFDRYTLSNAAYQSARLPAAEREGLVSWIFELEFGLLELPRPDLYIYLDVPPEISQKLTDAKGFREYVGDSGDIYEKNAGLQAAVRGVYLSAAKKLANMRVVACVENGGLLAPGEISDRVMACLSGIMEGARNL